MGVGGMPTTLLTIDHKNLWKRQKPKLYVKLTETETLKVAQIVRNIGLTSEF